MYSLMSNNYISDFHNQLGTIENKSQLMIDRVWSSESSSFEGLGARFSFHLRRESRYSMRAPDQSWFFSFFGAMSN